MGFGLLEKIGSIAEDRKTGSKKGFGADFHIFGETYICPIVFAVSGSRPETFSVAGQRGLKPTKVSNINGSIFHVGNFSCGLFSPLEGPESLRGGNPQKMGKNYKISLPGPTPQNGENWPQKGEKLLRKFKFCNFSVIFPHFRGSDRAGEFCNFSPFFGDFHPGGSPGSVRGKTTRKTSASKNSLSVLSPNRYHPGTYAISPPPPLQLLC